MAFRKVAEFKEISLEYVAPLGGTFRFFTDMPGGHLVERIAKALPATNADNTPATTTIVLIDGAGAPLSGTIRKERCEAPTLPAGVVQLRGGVIWQRTLGVSLDGALGEFWESLPTSIGA